MDFGIGKTGAKKRVAVVMPVYNDAAFVGASIQSVLDQTYTNFHFYIVDNGSTDGTPSVLQQFKDDPRITIVRRNRNAHSQAAPDLIRSLKNEVLALIFSDDIWEPNKLARSMESLGGATAVISNCAFMDDQGQPLLQVPPTQFYGDLTTYTLGELLHRIIFVGNPIHPVAVVVRMDAYRRLGGYLPFMNRIGDMQFFTALLINEQCKFIPDRLQRIRILAKQSSTYTSEDVPGAKNKTLALFHEQYYNLQNFVSPAGLAKLHLVVSEISESDSVSLKLWIFGQALLASRVNSYMFFGVNCLLKAATLDPVEIQFLVEKAVGTDVSHYFESLFQQVGQDFFNLNVITYDGAANAAYLSRRVAELEEYVRQVTPLNHSILSGGPAKRWYEKLERAHAKRARRKQRRVKTYTKFVQWLRFHPRIRRILVGPLNLISRANLFDARKQFARIHGHYFRPNNTQWRVARSPNVAPTGNHVSI
jgi:glycosyltransferase involved in cell wall biosynthesis